MLPTISNTASSPLGVLLVDGAPSKRPPRGSDRVSQEFVKYFVVAE